MLFVKNIRSDITESIAEATKILGSWSYMQCQLEMECPTLCSSHKSLEAVISKLGNYCPNCDYTVWSLWISVLFKVGQVVYQFCWNMKWFWSSSVGDNFFHFQLHKYKQYVQQRIWRTERSKATIVPWLRATIALGPLGRSYIEQTSTWWFHRKAKQMQTLPKC